MLDTPTTANLRDFSQRYKGTYGWLKKDEIKILVKITEVSEESVSFEDVNENKFYAYVNKNSIFEFLPVNRGWFYGASGELYYLRRVAAKQWHRGICDSNTELFVVTEAGLFGVRLKMKYIYDLFSSPATNKKYEFKEPSCALSKHFAILGKTFYFLDRKVGSYAKGLISLNENAHIKQEVMDVINRNNYGNYILVE